MQEELIASLHTGFIDKAVLSKEELRPRLVLNSKKKRTKVLTEITSNINRCSSFVFSIAFVNSSGIAAIKQSLLDLEEKNIHGTIITSTYLGFNSPKAFEELLEIKNIDVRVYESDGFHPKGYIFNYEDYQRVLVGSSNLTQSALSVNEEWNVSFTSLDNGEIVSQINDAIQSQILNSIPLTRKWIDDYKKDYVPVEKITRQHKQNCQLQPNIMQEQALSSLASLRKEGKDKALLISATGTGKTYLSAFDVRSVNPKRILFVVHRENIARAALKSFQRVMPDKRCGIYTGSEKDLDCDYLFATVQTIGRDRYLTTFKKDYFDYIIIDEVHRAGASMHQNVIHHFQPKFLLGMSATPERNDDYDIYKLFDYNIAYEIRLQQAMEYDLLCPFHYYGITDLVYDGHEIDDKTDFNYLVSDQRLNHILKAIQQYGYSGDKVRGLVFCSRNEEADELSRLFNKRGLRSVSLSGSDNDEKRRDVMNRLELEECDEALDYIFTVNIFNEGIDIPKVNQVVMLRPTESAIVFVQQLGRGLRKNDSKDYVVVIDFIGNYEKNFLIPIALSGNNSYNKDSLRRFVEEAPLMIPGVSTINFDLISKKKIYESIDASNFNDIKIIKESYKSLKQKLGRIPSLIDFDMNDAIDPVRIFDNKSLGSYYTFLKKYDKDYKIRLSDLETKYIEYVSKKFGSGKREKELEAIKVAIDNYDNPSFNLKSLLRQQKQIILNNKSYTSIINMLSANFQTGSAKKTYQDVLFLENNNEDYIVSPTFINMLRNKDFLTLLNEVIEFGLHRYRQNYSHKYQDTDLVLYEKYTYEDVCRLLNWEKGEVALNIGGYKYDKASHTFPVFINYEKKDVVDTINYEDRFINPSSLIAISKSKRTIESEDIQNIYYAKERNITIHLFVRKNKDDASSKEFYYLGKMNAFDKPEQFIMNNTKATAVEIKYQLDTPVRNDIYEYIVK